ncbi:MAG: hypothetical protein GY754_24660 [bacterium]|nr:hypothetical protein [bacterium]
MAKQKGESFNNLIDVCICFEENPELAGHSNEMFKQLLTDYFFKESSRENKRLEMFFDDLSLPPFIEGKSSLFDIDTNELATFVNGQGVNDSLAGTFMLSKAYLKTFFSNHPTSFKQLPDDVKYDLIDQIKDKNENIISAFEKMNLDKEADKKRKIITLLALILKNLQRKSGRPIRKLEKPAKDIIRSIFNNTDEIFSGSQIQMSDLSDDTHVKELIKSFFIIRQFKEITEMAERFKTELERYRKRGLKATS